jgi:hypothetical protein
MRASAPALSTAILMRKGSAVIAISVGRHAVGRDTSASLHQCLPRAAENSLSRCYKVRVRCREARGWH